MKIVWLLEGQFISEVSFGKGQILKKRFSMIRQKIEVDWIDKIFMSEIG